MLTDEQEIRTAIADVLADVLDPRKIFEARYELTGALMNCVVGPMLADVRQLTEERDQARDLAVACEQQLGEIERLAYMGGQSAHSTRRSILRVFEEAKPQ